MAELTTGGRQPKQVTVVITVDLTSRPPPITVSAPDNRALAKWILRNALRVVDSDGEKYSRVEGTDLVIPRMKLRGELS